MSVKYKIRRAIKNLKYKIDDAFGNPFIYAYQRTLLFLTIILAVAILIVIRECTAPLIIDTAFFRVLFVTSVDGDKTFYNIGISYIAAYIFYIVQVFLPEYQNQHRFMLNLTEENEYEFQLLREYIIAWNQFLPRQNCLYYHPFSYKASDNEKHSMYKDLYLEVREGLAENHKRIWDLSFIRNVDTKYLELISLIISKYNGFDHYIQTISGDAWHDEPLRLDLSEYKHIKEHIHEMERLLHKMERICKTRPLKVVEVSKYKDDNREIRSLIDKL